MVDGPWYFVGLDLGCVQDYTALVVVESTVKDGATHHAIRHIERFQLGTLYPAIVARVAELFAKAPLYGAFLAADATGVGRAVIDMLRAADIPCGLNPVVITAGHAVTKDDTGYFHVPKKELVGSTQMLLQSGRLVWSSQLPLAKVLADELANFRVKITVSANEQYEAWREKDHDDLVLAVFLAVWIAERALPQLANPPEPEADTVFSVTGRDGPW